MPRIGILDDDCLQAMPCSTRCDGTRSRHAGPNLVITTSDQDKIAPELLGGDSGGINDCLARQFAAALIVRGKCRHLFVRHPATVEGHERHRLPTPCPLAPSLIVVTLMLPLPDDIRWSERDDGVDSRIPDCGEERSLCAVRKTKQANPVARRLQEADRIDKRLDRNLARHNRLPLASEPSNGQCGGACRS